MARTRSQRELEGRNRRTSGSELFEDVNPDVFRRKSVESKSKEEERRRREKVSEWKERRSPIKFELTSKDGIRHRRDEFLSIW